MPTVRRVAFRYAVVRGEDRLDVVFYALNQEQADRYAKRWFSDEYISHPNGPRLKRVRRK